ncbi:MAG: phospholipase D family protein [Burkholderiales bacterium]
MIRRRIRALSARLAVAVALVAVALGTAGCASIDLAAVPRTPSSAIDPGTATGLHATIAARLDARPGVSGFLPLERGLDAFIARAALAEQAERTLDLQYYIVHGDTSGLLLLGRVFGAAERGVRVRLLIDDWTLADADAALAQLDAHPSIEVRVFNPTANRSYWTLRRWFEVIGDFSRINRRMHNKAWIADNAVAIVGGRNLGDEYFEAREDLDYHDLDLLAAGPIVAETSASFDRYWNSEFAVPLEAFRRVAGDAAQRAALREWFAAHETRVEGSPYAKALAGAPLLERLRCGDLDWRFGEARLLVDDPEKLRRDPNDPALRAQDRRLLLAGQFGALAPRPSRELRIVAPYFVPGAQGVATLGALVREGVSVRVLTNSLTSNDVLPAQAGYSNYRRALLEAGVTLYELKPGGPGRDGKVRIRDALGGSSRAALHEKSFVIDRGTVFVGSLNLDPRSVKVNTEVGALVRSEALAADVAAIFDRNAAPQSAWRVVMHEGRIAWEEAEPSGVVRRLDTEPGASAWRRFLQRVYAVLAPEDLL